MCGKGDRQAPCHPAPGLARQGAGILRLGIRQLAQKWPGRSQDLQTPVSSSDGLASLSPGRGDRAPHYRRDSHGLFPRGEAVHSDLAKKKCYTQFTFEMINFYKKGFHFPLKIIGVLQLYG